MRTVTVIGGGIAGLQAAVFTAKAGEDTLVLDNGQSLVENTSNIQNLIGHDSVSGHELLNSGEEKLGEFGAEKKEETVEKLERTGEGLKIVTDEEEYRSEYVIIASAGILDYIEIEEVEFEDGVEGANMMEKHIVTDESNKAAENVYAAGLANSWEHQTSVCIGDGAKAAVNLLTDLRGEPFVDHDM
ncbi:MAG: FAD-dependent oxidoreductase, partial [Candidatus Nanohalobium sp.]